MAVREILKMGDPRLLRLAQAVTAFDTDELHLLVSDLLDTMHAANGAGLAAPQIGVDLQLVVFGTGEPNPRYPEAPPVPRTVLVNPDSAVSADSTTAFAVVLTVADPSVTCTQRAPTPACSQSHAASQSLAPQPPTCKPPAVTVTPPA